MMQLQLSYFLILAAALFCIGIYGLVSSRNAVRVLMSIELMLNAVNLNLMGFSNYLDPVGIGGSGDRLGHLSEPRNGRYGEIQFAEVVTLVLAILK
jgi:NADH-ubiquinone/plastoquinone oxidoreductase chain 4L